MFDAASYNWMDRQIHNVAFNVPVIQRVLSEFEDDIFSRQLAEITIQRPVFITGLPRSGTTLILDMLYSTEEFSTFIYRQMPFVETPLLWDRLSSPFQKRARMQERAHADGMEVSFDSPEAFEEILWIKYLNKKIIGSDAINTLSVLDLTDEFFNRFSNVIRKLLLLNAQPDQTIRYLSKNNANISRIGLLRSMFPDAIILVPFREPLTHVSSLSRQHENFLALHEEDDFAKKYMQWIGHYDFGENFLPIDFYKEIKHSIGIHNLNLDFWLKYWSSAYRYCLDNDSENIHFVSFDGLLNGGRSALGSIADVLSLKNREKFIRNSDRLRSPGTRALDFSETDIDRDIINESKEVYHQLCLGAVNA